MIQLTRLNGIPIVLNSDLIKTAEASPDTMLTLVNGEKIIVRETCGEVTERVLTYRARLLSMVARRLPSYEDVHRVVALTSLDVATPELPVATAEFDIVPPDRSSQTPWHSPNSGPAPSAGSGH